MQPSYDVIIAGAGVIGLTQATALVQQGFRVAVVDAGPEPSLDLPHTFDVRVFALNHYSQQCLQQWGLWPNIETMRFSTYHDVALAFGTQAPDLIFHDADDAEPNLGYIVEQTVWRTAALEVLLSYDTCDFFWHSCLESVEEKTQVITGLFTQAAHQSLSLSAQLLIGADGIHSKTRALAQINIDQFPCHQHALIVNIRVSTPHHFQAAQYFCAEGIVAFLPLPDPHCFSIVWSYTFDKKHDLAGLADPTLASVLNNVCGNKWGPITILSAPVNYPLVQQQAQDYFATRIALIGDAAHTIHPLAGQGANLGIADAAALAQQLIWAKQHGRPLADQTILKRYARARRSAAWQMMALMSILQKTYGKYAPLNRGIKKVSGLLSRMKPLKNILSRFALYRFTQ